jgi:hypothetical protein
VERGPLVLVHGIHTLGVVCSTKKI